VTWSYSDSYVGWAPLPPTVVFGVSGYVGSPVVVSRTQYVFVPTNRFVGTSVASVRISQQQSVAIFNQTKPVTAFAVSGGIVRNTALPMATIERAHGGKIETRSISAAGPAPRAISGSSRVAVVAPPSEVKAAVASRPQAAHGAAPAREVKAPPAAAAARPQTDSRPATSSQEEKHAKNAHKAPEAAAAPEPHRSAPESSAREAKAPPAEEKHKAPADRQPDGSKVKKAPEAPPTESHHAAAEAPSDRQPPHAAEQPKPKPQAAKPKPKPEPKPEEKEKKPEGGN